MTMFGHQDSVSELKSALDRCRTAFGSVAMMSVVLNILTLGGSIFMMLVYDVVLPGRSTSTLVGLLIMISIMYVFQGVLDILRSRMLSFVSISVDRSFRDRVFDIILRLATRTRVPGDGLQPMRDLDQIRSFLASGGPVALIDLPWMLFFIAILTLVHWMLGLVVLIGGIILVALTFATERMSAVPSRRATSLVAVRSAIAEEGRRHAEVLQSMGMRGRAAARWNAVSTEYIGAHAELSSVATNLGTSSRVFRMFVQSVILAVGAYLVIDGQVSGGIIFASSILSSRALAPVETAIANWRGFMAARKAWERLSDLLKSLPPEEAIAPLPAPNASLSVEGVSIAPPGANRLTVQDLSFALQAGDAVGVIGPSGSGKSTMVRAVANIWAPVRGTVRLDGAALDQWSGEVIGQHIGYLPQNVELMDGTIAENIARFEPDASNDAIIAAARLADVHELILRLPEGYRTPVGADGSALSAGQRQRIALARALYRDPFLLVLDEPNSNLDANGEEALAMAIVKVRKRGGIVLLVAHRPAILRAVNKVLFMTDGRMKAFGPRDDVLSRILENQPKPVKITPFPAAPVSNRAPGPAAIGGRG